MPDTKKSFTGQNKQDTLHAGGRPAGGRAGRGVHGGRPVKASVPQPGLNNGGM
jgi:hypothetical protein